MRGAMEVIESRFKETEIGLIPKDWEVERLENVMEGFTPNKKLKQSDYKAIGKFPVIDQGQEYVAGFYDDETMVFDKDLPVILFGDHTRIIKYVDFPFICGADGLKIIIPKENFHRKYFYYALLNLNIPSRGYNRHFKILKEKLIPLPPLEEQKAIADILSTVQNAIEKTEKVINATKQLKKSIMKHLFTYGAVAVDEIEKVKLKESEIGLIPEHWEVVKLGEVFKITQKPKNLKLENYNLIPFIPMENIGFGTFNPKYVMKNPKDILSGTYFEKGDLLLAKITPSFENGKQSVVNDIPIEFGIATTEVIPLKQTEKSLISYLFYYLMKPEFRKYLALKMEGSTGRKRLPKEVLFNSLIPLPPLDEQQKIANILTTIDQKIQAEEKKKTVLQNLFKTLLQQLMTGKIRVKKTKT